MVLWSAPTLSRLALCCCIMSCWGCTAGQNACFTSALNRRESLYRPLCSQGLAASAARLCFALRCCSASTVCLLCSWLLLHPVNPCVSLQFPGA